MITIREAGEADVETIVGFNHALFQEDAGSRDATVNVDWAVDNGRSYFRDFMAKNGRCCWLAESEGRAVGYLAGYVRPANSYHLVKTAELESMYIHADYRSQGVGTALAQHFLQWAGNKGAKATTVTAYAANEKAVAFYQKLGFVSKSMVLTLLAGTQNA